MVRKPVVAKKKTKPAKGQPQRPEASAPTRKKTTYYSISRTEEDCKLDESIFEASVVPFETVEFGDFDAIRRLFGKNDVYDLMDSCFQNLMFPAVRRGNQAFEVVQFLHSKGVECNFRDLHHQTPLFHAISSYSSHQSIELLDFLLAYNCNLSDRDVMRCSPLLLAIQLNHSSVVEAFLSRQADVHVVDQEGNSSIHAAAAAGNASTLMRLCQAARNTKTNKNGQTPLDLCANKECESILRHPKTRPLEESFGMPFAEYEATQWSIRFDQRPQSDDATNAHVVVTFADPANKDHIIPYGSEAYKKEFARALEIIPGFADKFGKLNGVPAAKTAPWTQGVNPEPRRPTKCQKPKKMACKGG